MEYMGQIPRREVTADCYGINPGLDHGLIRPRLTEHYGIFVPQKDLPFAIPHLDEDLPLYLDPFLLWKSPSQQDQALHFLIINSFNHLGALLKKGERDHAAEQRVLASECDEISLGHSSTGRGKRVGTKQANEILDVFERIPAYDERGFRHIEEAQFYVDGIAKDRISDIAASFLKSFLIDFTMDEAERLGLPLQTCTNPGLLRPTSATVSARHTSTLADQPQQRPAGPPRAQAMAALCPLDHFEIFLPAENKPLTAQNRIFGSCMLAAVCHPASGKGCSAAARGISGQARRRCEKG